MGASNALAAMRTYGGKVPPTSLCVLLYMSLVALDKDAEPSYWDGQEMIAVAALGRPGPVTRSDLRAVERAMTPLFDAGAVTTVRHASGRGSSQTAKYRLWITHPAPDGNRRVEHRTTRHISSGANSEHPTVSGRAPDENRRTKEDKEDHYKERALRTVMSLPTDVEDAPPHASNGHRPPQSTQPTQPGRHRRTRKTTR